MILGRLINGTSCALGFVRHWRRSLPANRRKPLVESDCDSGRGPKCANSGIARIAPTTCLKDDAPALNRSRTSDPTLGLVPRVEGFLRIGLEDGADRCFRGATDFGIAVAEPLTERAEPGACLGAHERQRPRRLQTDQ